MRVSIVGAVLVCLAATVARGQGTPSPSPSSSTGSPGGMQVRVADVVSPDYVSDSNGLVGKAGALRIVAARGGVHSGKVVITHTAPIRGLSVQVSELKGAGTIPSSAVQVRYAMPWGSCVFPRESGTGVTYGNRPGCLGLLAENPLQVFPLGRIPVRRRGQDLFDTYSPVVPVWVTVRLPPGAASGDYAGLLTIRADGEKPATVSIELKVLPWTVPDPANWQTWAEVIQSPDTLSIEYGAEPWSAKHWELIGRSFGLLRGLGNRIVYVPLICHTNMGHEQSMVRWSRKDSGYAYDFSILDRYLDTAQRAMGKPQIVVFYVWENYMIRKGDLATGAAAQHEQQRIVDQMEKEGGLMGKGPAVTFVDEANKTVRMEYLPHYTDPAGKAMWKPLFAELGRHLTQRGLSKAAMLGMLNDCWPTKAEVEFFQSIAPDMPWVLHAHFGRADAYGLAKVGNRAQVWSLEPAKDKSLLGWKQPALFARFVRDAEFGAAPLHAWRFWAEYCITGNQRGVARLGAEYWPVFKDKQGNRKGTVWERYPESSWRNLGIYTALLAPAVDGPVATPRLEMFREGLQECEARIAIEKALGDETARGKLGADLAKRCQETLDERIARMHQAASGPGNRTGWSWTLQDGWQQRAERLFSLAGEVQKKLGG